jgi:cobalt-zinc-cadmium efflux system protein
MKAPHAAERTRPAVSRLGRLWIVLWLNLALVAGLVIVGAVAHSFAVLAEGGDFLLDAAGVGVGILAIWLSGRNGGAKANRFTNTAALVNAGWLLVLELLVVGGTVDRLITRVPEVHGLPVLVMSGVAAVVMVGAAVVLRGDTTDESETGGDHDSLMAAVLLDSVADAAAAVGVAVTGAVILGTGGLFWLDPAVALVVAVIVAYHAARLIWRIHLGHETRQHRQPHLQIATEHEPVEPPEVP